MLKSEFTYLVKLCDTKRSSCIAFEFDDPEEATMFCCTALRTFDALYELNVNMQITRRVTFSEEVTKHEPIQS